MTWLWVACLAGGSPEVQSTKASSLTRTLLPVASPYLCVHLRLEFYDHLVVAGALPLSRLCFQ
jgi:hypothetical protein